MLCPLGLALLLCLGGRSHEAYSNRACLSVCLSVCLSALVLKDGEESAGGNCNIDITR